MPSSRQQKHAKGHVYACYASVNDNNNARRQVLVAVGRTSSDKRARLLKDDDRCIFLHVSPCTEDIVYRFRKEAARQGLKRGAVSKKGVYSDNSSTTRTVALLEKCTRDAHAAYDMEVDREDRFRAARAKVERGEKLTWEEMRSYHGGD